MMVEREWYSPRQIKFTRQQCLWLIRNLEILRGGSWPREASSYIDIPTSSKSGRNKAKFQTPIEHAAEIEMRLEKAGIDGLILEAIECWDKSTASLSAYLDIPEWSIAKRQRRALSFIAGWRRRPSYTTFKEARNKHNSS